MAIKQLSMQDALEAVQGKRAQAKPSACVCVCQYVRSLKAGFISQLELYGLMGSPFQGDRPSRLDFRTPLIHLPVSTITFIARDAPNSDAMERCGFLSYLVFDSNALQTLGNRPVISSVQVNPCVLFGLVDEKRSRHGFKLCVFDGEGLSTTRLNAPLCRYLLYVFSMRQVINNPNIINLEPLPSGGSFAVSLPKT